MSLFNFNILEMFSFFAVLVRFTVLCSVLPFLGDRMIPAPLKILLGLSLTVVLFPILVSTKQVVPADAADWSRSVGGIVGTIGLEVLVALALGFTARLLFDGITMGANLVGAFMGFGAASTYDPHQESQTEVIAQIQTALAMLIFVTLDGHHLMLRASIDSYSIVGVGKAQFGEHFSHRLIQLSAEVFRFGLQISAPILISLFAVNGIFGIISRALPQLNILVLSFSVSASVGLIVMFLSMSAFQETVGKIFGEMGGWMRSVLIALGSGG